MKYKKKVTLTFNGDKLVKLADDLHIKFSGKRATIIIEKGFKTDLASVPRPLWWFIAPTDWGILCPAIMHDYFYSTHIVTRATADWLFREKMKDFKMGIIKRNLAYLAVRSFGWIWWNK